MFWSSINCLQNVINELLNCVSSQIRHISNVMSLFPNKRKGLNWFWEEFHSFLQKYVIVFQPEWKRYLFFWISERQDDILVNKVDRHIQTGFMFLSANIYRRRQKVLFFPEMHWTVRICSSSLLYWNLT